MAGKKRGLGKNNLKALLAETFDANIVTNKTPDDLPKNKQEQTSGLLELPISKCQPGQYQPRHHMAPEALRSLADSIRAQGIIQPIVVRPLDEGNYEIVAGERRFQAAKMAGLEKVPVVVKVLPDQAALAVALIENIQRENLNPIEEAKGYKRLIDEFELTHEALANTLGKSRTVITNALRLLGLERLVRRALEEGLIEMGHAKVLLGLKGEKQMQASDIIQAKKLTVREAEKLVASFAQRPLEQTASMKPSIDPDIKRLQMDLSERLAAKVVLNHTAKGKGTLVVHYNSVDELEGILAHLRD